MPHRTSYWWRPLSGGAHFTFMSAGWPLSGKSSSQSLGNVTSKCSPFSLFLFFTASRAAWKPRPLPDLLSEPHFLLFIPRPFFPRLLPSCFSQWEAILWFVNLRKTDVAVGVRAQRRLSFQRDKSGGLDLLHLSLYCFPLWWWGRNVQGSVTTARCLDRCGQYCHRKVTLSERKIAFFTEEKMPHANICIIHPPFVCIPLWILSHRHLDLSRAWLTRYPLEGRHGGLSAAYFPIAVMWSVSQVPSRPPTFPLYKARSPGSVTAPRGKLWNRTAGLVSGRADSAAWLLLIPY